MGVLNLWVGYLTAKEYGTAADKTRMLFVKNV